MGRKCIFLPLGRVGGCGAFVSVGVEFSILECAGKDAPCAPSSSKCAEPRRSTEEAAINDLLVLGALVTDFFGAAGLFESDATSVGLSTISATAAIF